MSKRGKNALIILGSLVISVILLVGLFELTKEQRTVQQDVTKNEAFHEVFEAADTFIRIDSIENVTGYGEYNSTINEVFTAQDKAGTILGYVMSITSHEGYMGDITFYLGVGKDGTTKGISITDTRETPGLGLLAEKVLEPQFKDKLVEMFSYTTTPATYDNQIDAISGATTTTNAVTNGVNTGLSYFYNELQGGVQNVQ